MVVREGPAGPVAGEVDPAALGLCPSGKFRTFFPHSRAGRSVVRGRPHTTWFKDLCLLL